MVHCPKCGNTQGPWEDNGGEVNFDLTFCCPDCGNHIDIASCDYCSGFCNLDDIVGDDPYYCPECWNKKEESDS
jgi:hypothetical protein